MRPFIMRIAVLAFFFVLGSALGAFADQSAPAVSNAQNHLSTKDLMNFCRGNFDVDAGYCAGYITAVAEIMLDHTLYGQKACNHGKVRSQQLMELFQMHVNAHPDRATSPAGIATAEAMAASFRCE
jgi:hypothetical protein